MPSYLLCHRHQPSECRIAFAAWKGFDSPLRRRPTMGSCTHGGHHLWWPLTADDRSAALALLPGWVAERTEAIEVGEVLVP
jgi:hypothetical protein